MKHKILIVDDAPVLRLKVKNVLTQHGFEVVGEAADGVQALAKYKELKPDLVTMDIVMPNRDGLGALEDILQFNKAAKVIMLSAIDQRDSLLKAIQLGALDYVVKPFEDDRVIEAVKKALNT
ncbi:MAG: two-component system chemotaxis response regulator CheY [Candidatus Omnitrophota bacterium]|jgi:two-component system chemotaxis response regulator CheY